MSLPFKKIDGIKIGDEAEFSIYLDEKTHNKFKAKTGDISPVHNDGDFAKKAGFKQKIAYGFDLISYFSKLYGVFLPGGSSICLSQTVKFIRPVYLKQKIVIRGRVIHVSRLLKIVKIRTMILDSSGELCVDGEGVVKIII